MSDPAKTRVLFVDDEPLVLQGFQRVLRSMRAEWDMAFVESGEAALRLFAERPFQVIVSDMRMPGMTGVQLLGKVQELYPDTVRLILSGHADKEMILKCAGAAHQFLAKPCEPAALREAIQRGREFDASVKSEKIKRLIGRMERLPSLPALLKEITEKLRQEQCPAGEIGEIIGKDIAMTAKLLKLVNSAFFGLRRRVSSPAEAVTLLGIDTIKSLVLTVNAFAPFEEQGAGPLPVQALWGHSMEVAGGAKKIARSAGAGLQECEEIFVAGMLHDIGKLALAANLPAEFAKVLAFSAEFGVPLHAAEETAFGVNHAEVGGQLLSLWGLPPAVVDAIGFHHQPRGCPIETRTAVMAVHTADAMVRGSADAAGGLGQLLDLRFLELTGCAHRIDEWKELLSDREPDSAGG